MAERQSKQLAGEHVEAFSSWRAAKIYLRN